MSELFRPDPEIECLKLVILEAILPAVPDGVEVRQVVMALVQLAAAIVRKDGLEPVKQEMERKAEDGE